jgi:predicted regulator of Ras-like GTPase activity (Roadblock/LC7/MglB family)
VQSQLARGAVRVSYEQLRSFSPAGLFPSQPPKDVILVDLPLNEILTRVKPIFLQKRPNQKRVEVPDEIGSVFGPGGHGLRVLDKDKANSISKPLSQSVQPQPELPVNGHAHALLAPMAQAPIQPQAPLAPPIVNAPVPAPMAQPAPAPLVPLAPPISPEPEPIRAPRLDPSLATFRPKPLNGTCGTFNLALMDVAAFWTEKGKNELANLYRHSLEIPINTLEAALKTGKLVFAWKEVRHWIRLAPGNTLPTIPDDLSVEFPLSLIAPRYLEHRGVIKSQKRLELSTDIPDVFASKGSAAAAPSEPAHAPKLPAPAAKLSVPGKSFLEYGEIFGQPNKKEWTLSEVAQQTSVLPGVGGAIIASDDGLLIAGTWPGGVKTDSVAGLIPQMYNRIAEYTKELKLKEPSNLTLYLEDVPLQFFKTGSSYLSVIGRPGEPLPKPQLNAVAKRLAKNPGPK